MDTAQPIEAAETDPNVQLQNAAQAFKSFDAPPIEQPRNERGQFARQEDDADTEEAEYEEELEAEQVEGEADYEADEADEEAEGPDEDEAHPLPPSWPADKAEVWNALPAEARALIEQRDAEQLRATNDKFQEIANARKAAEAEARKEASAKRDELINALHQVEGLYAPIEPDPRAFGYGTPQFNEAAYRNAYAEYQQNAQAVAQFAEQRKTLQQQADEEAKAEFREWKTAHEAEYAPKLLADMPELKDTQKGGPALRGLIDYAVSQGIPQEVFSEESQDEITSAQLHLLWKAQQFDKARAKPQQAKPKSAGPRIKPGVATPPSSRKAARRQKDFDRLDREGSIGAGAAVFKHFL